MLEKMMPSLSTTKADPRALLRANERSALNGAGDEMRDDHAGGFGTALAEDAARRQAPQKADRPQAACRAERPAKPGSARKPDDGKAEDTAVDNTGECRASDESADAGREMADAPGSHPKKGVEGEESELSGSCGGMTVPAKAPEDLTLEELAAQAKDLLQPICKATELASSAEPAPTTEVPLITLAEPAAPEKQAEPMAGPVVASAMPPVAAAPMIALASGETTAGEAQDAMLISPEGGRKASIPATDANNPASMLAATGEAEAGVPKTSVPVIPLAGADAAALTKSTEGKGHLHAAEAVSAPANGFAELIRDFAPVQGPGGLRAADPLAALDRSGMNGPAAQELQRPTPLQMLPIEMGMQAMRGNSRFQIRLDPPELGRVDVRLEISSSGEVKANMVVDRVETLAMLRRDSHSLQYAFEQAGLKQALDGLSFSLRGEGQNGQHAQDRRDNQGQSGSAEQELALLETQAAEKAMRRIAMPLSRIDLVI